jgi:hypothetical protein
MRPGVRLLGSPHVYSSRIQGKLTLTFFKNGQYLLLAVLFFSDTLRARISRRFSMSPGKLLIIIGIAIAVIGLALTYLPGLFGWFGKLPGDIRIERDKTFIFIPITSMIVISLALTLLANLFFRK